MVERRGPVTWQGPGGQFSRLSVVAEKLGRPSGLGRRVGVGSFDDRRGKVVGRRFGWQVGSGRRFGVRLGEGE